MVQVQKYETTEPETLEKIQELDTGVIKVDSAIAILDNSPEDDRDDDQEQPSFADVLKKEMKTLKEDLLYE